MPTLPSDADWLDAAARLATRARPLSRPNPGIGALVVRDGIVIGRGWTGIGGRPHAEALALAQAGSAAKGSTVYVTLEPCAHQSDRGPACADLIVDAKPAALVIGVEDPDPRTAGKGKARIERAGITVRQLDSGAARRSLAGYLTRQRLGRPHVTLKLALSLDGCIALPSGERGWITGPAARAHVHSRRALADAILVGGATWRGDAPRLDVRLHGLEDRSPHRYVLTRSAAPNGAGAISSVHDIAGMEVVQYLYVEGGAQTAAAFLAADLVDTLHLYRAPIVVGGMAAIADIGLTELDAAHGRWHLTERRTLGDDVFEAYDRAPKEETACLRE